jgi:hypothetical protein
VVQKAQEAELAGVFFSDDTYIEVGGDKTGVWHEKGKRPKVGRVKFPAKLMFWGAISSSSKSHLFAIDASMNSYRYIALLRDEFLHLITENHVEICVFQQEMVPATYRRKQESFFLNIILNFLLAGELTGSQSNQNVRSILKQQVQNLCRKSKEELKQISIEE